MGALWGAGVTIWSWGEVALYYAWIGGWALYALTTGDTSPPPPPPSGGGGGGGF